MEVNSRREEKLRTFATNLTRKTSIIQKEPLQTCVGEVINEFMSLFRIFRLYEQEALEKILSLVGPERDLVQRTKLDLLLRTCGFPDVILIGITNSIKPSTFAHEFFDFYNNVVGLDCENITKEGLDMIIEVLGKPERIGKKMMLNLLGYYGIESGSAMGFLQEGDAARRVLNPETSAYLFGKFRATSEDKTTKLGYCSFKALLPLMLVLFIETEIITILKYRVVCLDILGIPDSNIEEPKEFLFNDIFPFTKPIPKTPNRILPDLITPFTTDRVREGEEQEDIVQDLKSDYKDNIEPDDSESLEDLAYAKAGTESKIELLTRNHKSSATLIKVAFKVLRVVVDINQKVVTFRNIQSILNSFRISGFSVRATLGSTLPRIRLWYLLRVQGLHAGG